MIFSHNGNWLRMKVIQINNQTTIFFIKFGITNRNHDTFTPEKKLKFVKMPIHTVFYINLTRIFFFRFVIKKFVKMKWQLLDWVNDLFKFLYFVIWSTYRRQSCSKLPEFGLDHKWLCHHWLEDPGVLSGRFWWFGTSFVRDLNPRYKVAKM